MKEIIDKISSYNLFNYLFPGIICVLFLKELTGYNLIQENSFIGSFLYYFVGLVVSRFGSLVIGTILKSKKLKFIKFSNYPDYVFASDKDNKIELFSEINNMYRTIIAMLVLLLIGKAYQSLNNYLQFSTNVSYIFLIILLLILFIFSYKKQSGFVVKRIETRNQNKTV
jgi:Mn2+/Fe2+ NRAMP family transporter